MLSVVITYFCVVCVSFLEVALCGTLHLIGLQDSSSGNMFLMFILSFVQKVVCKLVSVLRILHYNLIEYVYF